jgi:hypothetical protein
MPEPHPSPELAALEEQLRGLVPQAGALDRDRILFRAGRASAPTGWVWRAVAGVSTLTAAALAAVLALQPPPQAVFERVVRAPAERPASPAPPASVPGEEAAIPVRADAAEEVPPHRRLQEHLLRWGLEGFGPPPPAPEHPPPRGDERIFPFSHPSSGETSP